MTRIGSEPGATRCGGRLVRPWPLSLSWATTDRARVLPTAGGYLSTTWARLMTTSATSVSGSSRLRGSCTSSAATTARRWALSRRWRVSARVQFPTLRRRQRCSIRCSRSTCGRRARLRSIIEAVDSPDPAVASRQVKEAFDSHNEAMRDGARSAGWFPVSGLFAPARDNACVLGVLGQTVEAHQVGLMFAGPRRGDHGPGHRFDVALGAAGASFDDGSRAAAAVSHPKVLGRSSTGPATWDGVPRCWAHVRRTEWRVMRGSRWCCARSASCWWRLAVSDATEQRGASALMTGRPEQA